MTIDQPLSSGKIQSSFQALYTAKAPLSNIEIGAIWIENVSDNLRVFSIGVMRKGVNTNLLTSVPIMPGYKIIIDKAIGLGLNDSIQGIADVNGGVSFNIFGKTL